MRWQRQASPLRSIRALYVGGAACEVRPLGDPRWLWLRFDGRQVVPWTPPPIGDVQQVAAAGSLS